MKLCLTLIAVLALSALPASAIADQYRTGILVHARPSQTDGKNCVTLTVLVENLVFVAQQCAALPWNQFVPAEFTERGDVEVRVEEDKLLLRRPSGKDLKARILKKALLRNSRRLGRILAPKQRRPRGGNTLYDAARHRHANAWRNSQLTFTASTYSGTRSGHLDPWNARLRIRRAAASRAVCRRYPTPPKPELLYRAESCIP